MKIDRFIQALLPHDDRFFHFFEESAQNLIEATLLLKKLAAAPPSERNALANQVHELEHKGDNVTHKTFAALNSTFVTPFDREDIHVLASALDDVMDYIDGGASRFVLYRIQECPKEVLSLIDILYASVCELQRGVALIQDMKDSERLHQTLQKINEYENKADTEFERAIADLFDKEKDPIKIIKLKEIYVGLETATDKCEDAANVMEGILIKHA